jgi:phospholipid/cholesterol/gamma-HCH transport system substrate-binding protein
MKPTHLELVVGLFLAIGMLCLAYLSVGIARKEFFQAGGYVVQAVFSNCSGLRPGSPIMVAGVEIGRVKSIALDDYEAKVQMVIDPKVLLQKDSIASIKTKGLIGEKYIELSPGGSDEKIRPGGTIHDTQPAMDVEGLIAKFVQGNLSKPSEATSPAK